MRYVLKDVASEDTIQLFGPTSNPVPLAGIAWNAIKIWIRKDGEAGYSEKTITSLDWTDRGNGNYALDFSALDFDVLGLFRYRVVPEPASTAFVPYEDALTVVEEIPAFPTEPPQINLQTDTPAGVVPDPVYRTGNLTINGTDLAYAQLVTIGGVPVNITGNTNDSVEVVVGVDVNLGAGQNVVVTTIGGSATTQVDVVLAPGDIPGSGMCNLYGYIHDVETGQPLAGIAVSGRVLDMPNIDQGVAWTDKVVSVVTDQNGRFDITLPRNDKVQVTIPLARYKRVFITPDVAQANLFTEIP